MDFAKNSLGTFATLVVAALVGIASGMITARVLEPQGVGVSAVVVLYPILFFTVGHLTFNIGTIYRIGQKKGSTGDFIANSLLVAVCMGVLLYAVFVLTLPLFRDTLYKGIDVKYFYISFLMLPCCLITFLVSSILQGLGRIKEYNIVNLVRCISSVLFLILFIVVFKFSVMGAVVASVLGYLLSAIAVLFYVYRQAGLPWKLNFRLLCDTLRDGGKIHIASISTFIYGQVGLIVANYYLSSAEVGYLFVALTCAQFLYLIPSSVQTVLYPEAAMATEEEAKLSSVRVCRHTVFWVFIAAIGLALFSNSHFTAAAFSSATLSCKV